MLYCCLNCKENIEFGGILFRLIEDKCTGVCVLCGHPVTIASVNTVASITWNERANWSIPLPQYQVGVTTKRGAIKNRQFIPDEAPVIPSGWMYEVGGEWRCEFEILACRPDLLSPIGG